MCLLNVDHVFVHSGVLVSAESLGQPIDMALPKAPSTPAAVKEEKYKREVEKLNKQIGRYRDIIEQQEKLLQVRTSHHPWLKSHRI